MAKYERFEDLPVWQHAIKINESTYQEYYLDLVDLASELKGLIKYLNEFEDKKKKGD